MKKTAALLLAVLMCFGAASCGSSDSSSKSEKKSSKSSSVTSDVTTGDSSEAPASAGTEQQWGAFTVTVPDGFEFKGGDVFDETDTRYFSVKNGSFKYFDFRTDESEDAIMQAYNYNKDTYTNGQKDVEDTFGDNKWTGFQYDDGFGGCGFEAYTQIGNYYVKVASAGYDFSSEEAKAVLSSLKVSEVTDAPADSSEASSETADESSAAVPEIEYVYDYAMKTADIKLPAKYTVVKEGGDSQLVFKSDDVGGQIAYLCGSDTAEEAVKKVKGELEDAEDIEWDINGTKWAGYTTGVAYCLAADTEGGYFLFSTDYSTEEEVRMLIGAVTLK